MHSSRIAITMLGMTALWSAATIAVYFSFFSGETLGALWSFIIGGIAVGLPLEILVANVVWKSYKLRAPQRREAIRLRAEREAALLAK